MIKSVLITSRSFGQVSDEPFNILKEYGCQVDVENQSYVEDRFLAGINKYDALIIGAHEFSQKAAEKARRLKIICKHGSGVDNINLEAAKEHKIRVTNVPATNADAVADLTFGLMLDVARKISYAAGRVKRGFWERIVGTDVCCKTLGLIGFGAIGKKVAKRAGGFAMNVLAYDPYVSALPDGFSHVKLSPIEDVIRQADFLSVHVPLTEQTKGLIGGDQLAMMKKGSFIINTSRGGIINEAALYEYLKDGHLSGAGLDVVEKEPPTDNPLLTLDNVTILPHIGMYSQEAITAVSLACARNVIKQLFTGEPLENVVV